jgi:hypothetical protein
MERKDAIRGSVVFRHSRGDVLFQKLFYGIQRYGGASPLGLVLLQRRGSAWVDANLHIILGIYRADQDREVRVCFWLRLREVLGQANPIGSSLPSSQGFNPELRRAIRGSACSDTHPCVTSLPYTKREICIVGRAIAIADADSRDGVGGKEKREP